MYCPVCFNDTLKIASSGVVKLLFNGKAKSTSQFFYNLSQDKDEELLQKIEDVVKDYFIYYSGFQNKDPIENIDAYSIDFKCENKCVININHKVNVIGLLFSQDELNEIVERLAKKYNIPIDLKDLKR
ncbi:MAG: hypothetical protein QF441_04110 [Bacteriovoracaceae bacterium]|jgi:hypothetical protein|nr:hypothetical protein [Halobacteriovoraceae bacterium]MDP7319765.1 hypothetical protein [Bacteriovoracaceae bacterium]|tara:strand:+ start:117 stop:500 length:384 start_codon:yes stop_codon:yes gene_type:complete